MQKRHSSASPFLSPQSNALCDEANNSRCGAAAHTLGGCWQDRAVGRVAGEVLFVFEAPRVELGEGAFYAIPVLSGLYLFG